MRLETVATSVLLGVFIITAGLLVLADSAIKELYYAGSSPSFNKTSTLFGNVSTFAQEMNRTIQSTDVGQNPEGVEGADQLWTRTVQSFKTAGLMLRLMGDSESAIWEWGNYLRVSNLIIVGLILFLVISVGFALTAFWRGRRP